MEANFKKADWFAPGTAVYEHACGLHDPVKDPTTDVSGHRTRL